MKRVKLIDITLDSSSIAGSTYDEYVSGTTYATDDNVKVSFESDEVTAKTPVEEYVSLADANTGNYPPDEPTKWSLLGTSNKWKMFDEYINVQSEDISTITVEVDASKTNTVGLFNLQGTQVTFTLTDENTSTIKKTEVINLDVSPTFDYYEYYFGPFMYRKNIRWEYPRYANSTLKVEITIQGGYAKCGMCVIGNFLCLGKTQWSPNISIADYSKKDTDSLGRIYLKQGNYADKLEFDAWIDTDRVDSIKRLLTEIRGTLSMMDANGDTTDFECLLICGVYQDFDIIIPGPNQSKCSMSWLGLT
jgi:hypothetical protein